MYREINLGSEGKNYLRNCLREGKTFAKYLFQTHNIEEGTVTTFLPGYVSEEEAKKFGEGKLGKKGRADLFASGKRFEAKANMDFWLIDNIQKFFNSDGEQFCIFENALARPLDTWLSRAKSIFFTCDQEVYHFLWNYSDKEKIVQTLKEATYAFPPLIAGLISLKKNDGATISTDRWKTLKKISPDDLAILAENTKKIIVGAYDGEGYVIWSKAGWPS
jgi:hypothetical protein